MADGVRDWAENAFREIHPDNPLKKLNDTDRMCLWTLLVVYAQDATNKRTGAGAVFFKELESLSKTAAEAAKLGRRIRAQILEGRHSQAIRPFTVGFEDLPSRLAKFSRKLGMALNTIGKSGQKRKIHGDRLLIEVSEFVRLKTGRHYDEHLAELFQAIGMQFELEELSGAAISKKRLYLKKRYPVLYADALKRARILCENSPSSAISLGEFIGELVLSLCKVTGELPEGE